MSMSYEVIKDVYNIPVGSLYMCEIYTTTTLFDENSYLSFVYLFDYWVKQLIKYFK